MDNDRSRTFRIIKIDFLGLRNLSIIHQIVTQVKYDLNVEIDIEAIPSMILKYLHCYHKVKQQVFSN